MTSTHLKNETGPSWPYGSILLYGTFGTRSGPGQRYQRRGLAALLLWILVQASAAWVPQAWHSWYWPTTGLAFAYISSEWWRYMTSLDELERKLQMEAAAWSYAVTLALAAALSGLQMNLHWRVSPGLLVLVEVLRTWRLYRLARRYE